MCLISNRHDHSHILLSTMLCANAALAALSYLDDKAIIHRDIKLPNILLHDGELPSPTLSHLFASPSRVTLAMHLRQRALMYYCCSLFCLTSLYLQAGSSSLISEFRKCLAANTPKLLWGARRTTWRPSSCPRTSMWRMHSQRRAVFELMTGADTTRKATCGVLVAFCTPNTPLFF